jgi:hypothetical protein
MATQKRMTSCTSSNSAEAVNKCREGPTSTTSKDGGDAAAARAGVGLGAARGGGGGGKERTSAMRLARSAGDTCGACAFDKSRHNTSARPTAEVCPGANGGGGDKGDGGDDGERASRAAAERILRRRLRLRLGHNLPPTP